MNLKKVKKKSRNIDWQKQCLHNNIHVIIVKFYMRKYLLWIENKLYQLIQIKYD